MKSNAKPKSLLNSRNGKSQKSEPGKNDRLIHFQQLPTVSLPEFPDRYKLVQAIEKVSGLDFYTDEIDDFHLLSSNVNSSCCNEILIDPLPLLKTIQRPGF